MKKKKDAKIKELKCVHDPMVVTEQVSADRWASIFRCSKCDVRLKVSWDSGKVEEKIDED